MNKTAMGLIAVVGGLALVIGLSKVVSGASCMTLSPYIRYQMNYPGPRKLLPAVIGDAWSSIYYFEVWNDFLGYYDQPIDPLNYYLEPNSRCAILLTASAKICGFIWKL